MIQVLQSGATANGNGTAAQVDQVTREQYVEIVESAGGTATVTLVGQFTGASDVNQYNVGYQKVDATATPARAVTGISVAANSAHVYQLLDFYPQVFAVLSAVAGGANVTVRLYSVAG